MSCLTNPDLYYGKRKCSCAFHQFLSDTNLSEPTRSDFNLTTLATAPTVWYNYNRNKLFPESNNTVKYVPPNIYCDPVGHYRLQREMRKRKRNGLTTSSYREGEKRLVTFLSILYYVCTENPFANEEFTPNDNIIKKLTATHLKHIVGHRNAEEYYDKYTKLIDQEIDFHRAKHLLWVTNRQQGKTETVAKFISTLMITSLYDESFINTYCTSQDKAAAILNDAKKYIKWFAADEGAKDLVRKLGYAPFRGFQRSAHTRFSVFSIYGHIPLAQAQPKSIKACRGDKAPIIIIDEAGFVEVTWFWQFAYPLMASLNRTFTFITTPPMQGTFFSNYIRTIFEANSDGKHFVHYENHALMCSICNASDPPDIHCAHHYGFIPQWKSAILVEQMYHNMPESERANYILEVLGVMYSADNYLFNENLVQAVFHRDRRLHENPFTKKPGVPNTIYISIDPGSHDSSKMGLSAHTFTSMGTLVILGIAEVFLKKNVDFDDIVIPFCTKVFNMTWVRSLKKSTIFEVVPWVERNFSNIVSGSILEAIRVTCGTNGMLFIDPFTHPNSPFQNCKMLENGIRTDESSKEGYVIWLRKHIIDQSIILAKDCITHGKLSQESRHDTTQLEMAELLITQFCNFRKIVQPAKSEFTVKEKYKLTGITAQNRDDVFLALGIGAFYSAQYRYALGLRESDRGKKSSRLGFAFEMLHERRGYTRV